VTRGGGRGYRGGRAREDGMGVGRSGEEAVAVDVSGICVSSGGGRGSGGSVDGNAGAEDVGGDGRCFAAGCGFRGVGSSSSDG